jgi:serine acetyltransferase
MHMPEVSALKYLILPTPTVSIAALLRDYPKLNVSAKILLAYTLAPAVWLHYTSHWMNTAWSSDTIHFASQQVDGG